MFHGGLARSWAIATQDRGDDGVVLLPGFRQASGQPELGPAKGGQPAARHRGQLVDVRAVGTAIEPAVELGVEVLIVFLGTQPYQPRRGLMLGLERAALAVGHALGAEARAYAFQLGHALEHRGEALLKFFGDAPMQAGFEAALGLLETLGCRLVEIPFSDFYATANLLYEGAWVAERYAAISDFMDANEAAMHPVTRKIIGGARSLSAADAFRGLLALQAYKAKLAPVVASVDLFCVPTAPTHYTTAAVLADPVATNSRLGTYTNFVNLLDMCGVAVPTGKRGDGLPMNVTLLAPAGRDALTAMLARDLHAQSGLPLGATGWPQPGPRPAAVPPCDGMIDLVVVGAHLSGMPLNGQLNQLGAHFLRATRTAAAYKLYALVGQSVPKPGLIRVADGGMRIDVEVWRLGPEAFGRFVAAIPAPLGIGTVELDDGTPAKGFLVEGAGLDGASDISSFGGWRRFIARGNS